MPKMHQILAVEKQLEAQRTKLLGETKAKLGKISAFFQGYTKRLKMLSASPSNDAEEAAAAESKLVPTSVLETLEYTMTHWLKAEENQFLKNIGNQMSRADILFRGAVLLKDVPVDQIMGFEGRVTDLRNMFEMIPTLDPSKSWDPDTNRGFGYWKESQAETKVKTAQIPKIIVLFQPTDKHPGQAKEANEVINVGTFTTQNFSSAITGQQKADMMTLCDELLTEIKKARVVANDTEVPVRHDTKLIVDLLLAPIKRPTTVNKP